MKTLHLSPHLAAEALLQRRRIRTDLEAWCTEVLRPAGHKPAAHHKLLIHELEKVARGETQKLMVIMPPGSAKSTYSLEPVPGLVPGAAAGPARPRSQNTSDLAKSFSRRVRGRIREHSKLLGLGLGREAGGQLGHHQRRASTARPASAPSSPAFAPTSG
jgi:hypothetical protein